jgi:hypothetical protein
MKTTMKQLTGWTGALAVAVVAVAGIGMSQGTEAAGKGVAAIRGVWDSTITLHGCNGGPVINSFRALNLFEHNGSLIATSEVAQPPSLGYWESLGGQQFRAVFRFQRFGAGGVFEGITQVSRDIHMAPDGQSFTSVAAIAMYDIADTLFAEACGTETATKVF